MCVGVARVRHQFLRWHDLVVCAVDLNFCYAHLFLAHKCVVCIPCSSSRVALFITAYTAFSVETETVWRSLCLQKESAEKDTLMAPHQEGPVATEEVVACNECYSVTAVTYISREGAMREACLDSTNELITLYLYK